jgi:hypothetical protein
MLKKYAIINNNVVTEIVEIDDETNDFHIYSSKNQLVIDIDSMSPQPVVGYVLNGNKLELPQGFTDREAYEEHLNDLKSTFGTMLSKKCINKIGARNKILNKNGAQVTALLNTLLGVRFLLEGGALGTARNSCVQLKSAYTEYSDIFDYVINEINIFEQNNSL